MYDALLDIYLEYGYFRERLVSVYKRGRKGAQEIRQMMKDYRENPPKTLSGSKVVAIKDYKTQKVNNLETGKTAAINLPVSNVLQFGRRLYCFRSSLGNRAQNQILLQCEN